MYKVKSSKKKTFDCLPVHMLVLYEPFIFDNNLFLALKLKLYFLNTLN